MDRATVNTEAISLLTLIVLVLTIAALLGVTTV